jgi:hypothetical protein
MLVRRVVTGLAGNGAISRGFGVVPGPETT